MVTRERILYLALSGAVGMTLYAEPEWVAKIRPDHPRLFLNADLLPGIRARALGDEKARFDRLKSSADSLKRTTSGEGPFEPADMGVNAARDAFVFLVTEDPSYRDSAVKSLRRSLDFYDQCFAEKKPVNWYSTSRVHAILAWDWLYSSLPEAESRELMERLVSAIDNVLQIRPRIHRENYSDFRTGYYGVRNCCWFLACTACGTGIRDDKVNEWLIYGYEENMRLLEHRRKACGDDGGSASPTLGYAFGAYPWSEQNFLYTWLSATGENIAPNWPHSAWLANYVIWNWIPGPDGPLEFGYGDTPHTTNRLPCYQLYTHMANIRHLFGEKLPEAASLAKAVQAMLPEKNRHYSNTWFIYPFLLTGADAGGPALDLNALPNARHFDATGQIFMRSGTGLNDTYCLFTCGGVLAQHRHYDALNFIIVHRSAHLALDSGTRYREMQNGEHLANYYAQTVAHNCVLIHQPGEPPARYWGGTVTGNHGGQHKQLGSKLVAFESNDRYVYVAGDATTCYQHGPAKDADGNELPEKCSEVTRQMVFIFPDTFVIFDRVIATDPAYRKEWLLHTANDPIIDGHTIRAEFGDAAMICQSLLPAQVMAKTVGGEDKEFMTCGKNWALDETGLKPEQKVMMGQWRVEISPKEPTERDLFLHVIKVGSKGAMTAPEIQRLNDETTCGAKVLVQGNDWIVRFARQGPLSGAIEAVGDSMLPQRSLATTVTPQTGILP